MNTHRYRALARTIAYGAGTAYMLHISGEEPQVMEHVLMVVGIVTVACLLVGGAIVIIVEWSEDRV